MSTNVKTMNGSPVAVATAGAVTFTCAYDLRYFLSTAPSPSIPAAMHFAPANRDLSLDIPTGETLFLVGPSPVPVAVTAEAAL